MCVDSFQVSMIFLTDPSVCPQSTLLRTAPARQAEHRNQHISPPNYSLQSGLATSIMARSNTAFLLILFIIFAFCLSGNGVYAFGAGNIPSYVPFSVGDLRRSSFFRPGLRTWKEGPSDTATSYETAGDCTNYS